MAIHPTAIIDRHADIDGGVEIGPHCVIDGNVRIATGCRLYQNVYVTGWSTIEEDCVIHPNAIVGHEPQDVNYKGDRSFCRIGRGTVLRENVTIHRGTMPESHTVVGERCFLLGGAHVAHNCVLGDRVTMVNNVLLAGHVEVGHDVTLGGAAVVHQFVRIGALAMIPGNARVLMDIPPYALATVDGRVAGLNRVGMRRSGISPEAAAAVREAYRVLDERGLAASEKADRIAALGEAPELRTLAGFVRSQSRRRLAGRRRRGIAGDASSGD